MIVSIALRTADHPCPATSDAPRTLHAGQHVLLDSHCIFCDWTYPRKDTR